MSQSGIEPGPAPPRWIGSLHRMEDGALFVVLGLMVLVGTSSLDLWARMGLRWHLPGAESLLCHLTLLAGIIGGAVAAREGRLISISAAEQFLSGAWKQRADLFANAVATGITAWLGWAAFEFVRIEWSASSEVVPGLQARWFQVFLPAGFALLAVRLLRQTSKTWKGRLAVAAVLCVLGFLMSRRPLDGTTLAWLLISVLVAATALGAPIFVTLGGAALILFWTRGEPIASIPLDHYDQVTNPLLATLPLFTLAGYVLAQSKASERLVRFFSAWTGFVRGGPAIVTVLSCAFFTAFTGGSGVTILALGGLLMPVLLSNRYDEKTALGFLTGAGSLGILLPPCLPLIIYSIIGRVSLQEMFLAGLLPGLLLLSLTIAWGAYKQPPRTSQTARFSWQEAWKATLAAKWELALPLIPIVLIAGGLALPVPAAAATACYALVIEMVVHRDLKWSSSLPKVFTECGLLIGGVLLILGAAMGFTNFLITQHVPDDAAVWIGSKITNKYVFLLALNVFLIAVGCLMDIFSAIIVIVPLIVPMAAVFNIDPLHLGIIFLANLELGYLTPPIGLNLFLASSLFKRPVFEIARASFPILLVLLVGVLLITYVPALTTWLPAQFRH